MVRVEVCSTNTWIGIFAWIISQSRYKGFPGNWITFLAFLVPQKRRQAKILFTLFTWFGLLTSSLYSNRFGGCMLRASSGNREFELNPIFRPLNTLFYIHVPCFFRMSHLSPFDSNLQLFVRHCSSQLLNQTSWLWQWMWRQHFEKWN